VCLALLFAVAEAEKVQICVVVVDSASDNGSASMIEDEYPRVDLVRNGRNRGFGAANNIGFAQGGGELVLLLNTDRVVRPGALKAMRDVLRREPDVGAVWCRLENAMNHCRRVAGAFRRRPWLGPKPWG
jgi:GT2 family glycosyltransferase